MEDKLLLEKKRINDLQVAQFKKQDMVFI